MSPWCWVPVLFVASLVSKRWMPLFAALTVFAATVWWEKMLGDIVLWLSS
ncbi:MAG: hypothetical protein O2999_06550 [Nitrospirae bacterium]|nr:hypothetical protein [Nitrospirota bacterium]MDA1303943.1 hypothetical protein [Nitrospirota bacterium]